MIKMELLNGNDVILDDKNPETLRDEFREVVRDNLGWDMEEVYSDIIFDIMHPIEPVEDDNYELIADGYYNALNDTRCDLEDIIAKLSDMKRMNKAELLYSLNEMLKRINSYV